MATNKSRTSGPAENPDNDTATRGACVPTQTSVTDDAQSLDPSLSGLPSQISLGSPSFPRESTGDPRNARDGAAPGSMLDPAALAIAPGAAPTTGENDPLIDLSPFSLAQLMEIRLDIDALLPPHTLQDMDLEEELLLQYQLAKDLMTRVLAGGAQPNHKSQTVSTCANILATVTKSQAELHNSERVKAIELALERTFKDRPPEEKLAFFEHYDAALREVASAAKKRDHRKML